MGSIIGIDLGTTFSAVATLDDTGRPVIVHNQDGVNLTPSCVASDGPNSVIVGEVARRTWSASPQRAAARFKRDMGTPVIHRIEDQTFSPTELSAFVLKKLVQDASVTLGTIDEVVITIPANFSTEAREATMAAAKAADLQVKYIINEPTAAALYYAFKNGSDLHGHYAVYDLGGGTFDVSIIKVTGQEIDVIRSGGLQRLGGADFDIALQDLVAGRFKQLTGLDMAPNEYKRSDAEEDKKSLSNRKQVLVEVRGQTITITREDFDQAISSLVAQAELLCEATLDESKLKTSDIKAVFLAGGSTRIPSVRESVRRVFGQEPTSSANVDEVVALGAALYAAYRSDRGKLSVMQQAAVQKIRVLETTNKCFGTISLSRSDTSQGERLENSVLIKKGERIPCSVTETFYTVADGQTQVECQLTESDAPETDPQFVQIVRSGALELPAGRPAGQVIEITYSYDANQIIRCTYLDKASGRKTDFEHKMVVNAESGLESVNKFLVE